MNSGLRRFSATHLVLALVAALSLAADCDFRGGEGGLYDPCTRDHVCRAPLVCLSGACTEATRDAGVMDASSSDAASADGAIDAGVAGDAAAP